MPASIGLEVLRHHRDMKRWNRGRTSLPGWDDPPVDVPDYTGRLAALGLEEYAAALAGRARTGVRLTPVGEPGAATATATHLGGEPLLPPDVPWPEGPQGPLSLLLQVDLAQLPRPAADALPADGVLSFFYDAVSQDAWGSQPGDRGSWAVLHSAAAGAVRRAFPADLDPDGRFRAWELAPTPDLTYVPWESWDVEALGITEPHRTYGPVFGEPRDVVEHRLLGHPRIVQGDMQQVCQLASNGVDTYDDDASTGERSRRLAAASGEWRLLAQVDSSEDETGMLWGDLGRVYFWIREEDLVERRWDRVWLVMQCG
jgi:uncharacterized protein YwqG